MSNVEPYEILTGSGVLYVASVGTAFPAVNAVPGAAWLNLGDTDGGITITPEQTVVKLRGDQSTGPQKAIRTEEELTVATNLQETTIENLARVLGSTVTDVAPGAGTIGTRAVALHRGATVTTYAFLFRKEDGSPYGDFPAQFELPVGYFDGPTGLAFAKDNKVLVPVSFVALEDPHAGAESDRFGRFVVQDAAAI